MARMIDSISWKTLKEGLGRDRNLGTSTCSVEEFLDSASTKVTSLLTAV